MDPLNLLLITWLAVAAFIFVVMQKITEIWPPTASHPPQQSDFSKRISATPTGHAPEDKSPSYGERISQLTNQIRDNFTAKIMPHLQRDATSATAPVVNRAAASSSAYNKESVQWLNEFLTWFFRYYRGKVTFLDAWCRALNDAAKKLAATTGYDIIFEEIKPVEDKTVPNLSNVRTEKGPRESLNIRCQIHVSTISFKFVASQKVQDKMIVTNHVSKMFDLEGQLQTRLVCMGGELFAMMCFDGQPSLIMDLEQNYPENDNVDKNAVEQVVRRCLSSAIVNMSFLDYHQHHNDNQENGSPKVKDGPASPDTKSSLSPIDDLFRRLSIPPPAQLLQSPSQVEQYNRLLVKILRAETLAEIIPFTEPYVIVELDDPPQKHTTTLAHGTDPMWDEHFLFDIDQQKSQELLFEVYGKSNDPETSKDVSSTHQKFLGLAIISVEEIRQSAITKHSLTLQPRPYIKDKVSGTLFVECLFVYASKQDHDEEFLFQELEVHMKHHGGHITTAYANRDNEMLVLKIPELDNAKTLDNKPRSSSSSNIVTTESKKSPFKLQQKAASCSTSPNRNRGKTPESTTLDGRGRKKERPSFFSHWKDRLSRRSLSRQRAQSAELTSGEKAISPTDFTYHPQKPPQVATATLLTRQPDELIVPQSISHLELGPGLSDESEMSGGSTEALHQTSSLVVEVLQNNLKRYFYIPASLAKTSKVKQLIKSGKKLHILNDHTFVAVKLPSTSCKVCLKALTTTFRKQGYQCRDCRIMCHKRCYERATGFSCPNSRLSMLHIEKCRCEKSYYPFSFCPFCNNGAAKFVANVCHTQEAPKTHASSLHTALVDTRPICWRNDYELQAAILQAQAKAEHSNYACYVRHGTCNS